MLALSYLKSPILRLALLFFIIYENYTTRRTPYTYTYRGTLLLGTVWRNEYSPGAGQHEVTFLGFLLNTATPIPSFLHFWPCYIYLHYLVLFWVG